MHGPFCQRTDHRKTDIHAGTNTHAMHAAARHWQRVPSTAIDPLLLPITHPWLGLSAHRHGHA
jgi:hypothetical protein